MTSKKLARSSLLFASLFLILFPISSFAIQADVKDISDEKYFTAVHEEILRADNPLRHAGYVEGILKREVED